MHGTTAGVSFVEYDLPPRKFLKLRGKVTINDTADDYRAIHGMKPLIFKIVGDGKEIWKSKPILKLCEIDAFEVELRGVRKLKLLVECSDDYSHAHALWIDPIMNLVAGR